jgi:hypothetical protein
MPVHWFNVGQIVASTTLGIPPGPYTVLQLLAPVGAVANYWVISLYDGHERELSELQLTEVVLEAPETEETEPAKGTNQR